MNFTSKLFNETKNDDLEKPIYHGTRMMFGLFDLVVSYKTNKCPFNCNFCALPLLTNYENVSEEQLIKQTDWVLNKYSNTLSNIEQLSIRNEGNVLNPKEFYLTALEYIIEKTSEMPNLKKISLETRLEFVNEKRLKEIINKLGSKMLNLTIGFETQDDRIRNEVLGKKFSKELFENKVALLGSLGIELTAYIMLKPDPEMSEQKGVIEAIKSINYLHELSLKTGTKTIIYINPTYAAEGSKLYMQMKQKNYQPPTKESLEYVLTYTNNKRITVYTD